MLPNAATLVRSKQKYRHRGGEASSAEITGKPIQDMTEAQAGRWWKPKNGPPSPALPSKSSPMVKGSGVGCLRSPTNRESPKGQQKPVLGEGRGCFLLQPSPSQMLCSLLSVFPSGAEMSQEVRREGSSMAHQREQKRALHSELRPEKVHDCLLVLWQAGESHHFASF